MSQPGPVVGRVRSVWRYPVKSMAAETVEEAAVGWSGLEGDRRWAFLRDGSEGNRFPWHTIREHPAMCRWTPSLTEPGRPDASDVEVRDPDGRTYALTDPAVADALGEGVRLMRLGRGTFDAMPVTVISTGTVEELCRLAGVAPDPLRFRPNLLVEPATSGTSAPYVEDDWVGATLAVGDDGVAVRVDRRDPRCAVIDVDPATGERTPGVLRTVGRERDACAGVYGSVVREGVVRAGDAVRLEA